MLALWNALHSGAIPQLGPMASTGTFHHGALYYDLMLPGAWLGGGAPTWVLVETALGGLMVVPMVWWVARSIAGPLAGLAAALLAATSAGLVVLSTFIWNPTPVEPGAALALLGAWQAWSSRNPVWLLAAAAEARWRRQHLARTVPAIVSGTGRWRERTRRTWTRPGFSLWREGWHGSGRSPRRKPSGNPRRLASTYSA